MKISRFVTGKGYNMGFSTYAGIAALAATAYGASEQHAAAGEAASASRSQAAERRAQAAAEQRIADIKNARERAAMTREARVVQGKVEAAAASGNTSYSSGAAGGLASVGTQEASNLGLFSAVSANQADITASRMRESFAIEAGGNAAARSANGQALFSLGSSIFTATGGFKNIFDTSWKTKTA